MADPYLVLFVADEATDEHADELEELVRLASQLHPWAGAQPRFFDQVPIGSTERTVGVHLRVTALPEADRHAVAALVHAVAVTGERLGVRIAVQLEERPVGALAGGIPEAGVVVAMRERLSVELD